VAGLAVSPRRLLLLAEAAVFSLPPVAALLVAWRSTGLTDRGATLGSAAREGHRLALLLVALGAAAVGLLLVVRAAERRMRVGRRARRILGAGVALAAVLALAGGIVRVGGVGAGVERGYHAFVGATPPVEGTNLTGRLFEVNSDGRVQLWRVAVRADHGRWLTGTGAGSFARTWDRDPRSTMVVQDAHSLYVETLSELGVVGLLLLSAALVIPVVAALQARALPCVPLVLGAYVAFVVHNAVDWDWELSAVALTGLLVGCVLLIEARPGSVGRLELPARVGLSVAVAVVAAFAVVATVGNRALATAQAAIRDGAYPRAASQAALARRWMPWSPEPLKALGTARLELGDTLGARQAFREGVSLDPHDWQAWLDLAAADSGPARARDVAKARSLYPASPEVSEFEAAVRDRSP